MKLDGVVQLATKDALPPAGAARPALSPELEGPLICIVRHNEKAQQAVGGPAKRRKPKR